MTNALDSFETQLLGELRDVVAARSAATEKTLGVAGHRSQPSRPRRRVRAASLLAVAAASAAAVVVPGLVGSPAFAVQAGPNGTIEVEVNRLEDAAGLEAALRDLGVKADIAYLGSNMQCAKSRYENGPSAPGSATRFSVAGGIDLTLDRRDLSHDETVVIAASRITNGVYAEMGIAVGPVAPCQPIPLPADQR